MSKLHYLMDTCFLLELYQIPGRCCASYIKQAKKDASRIKERDETIITVPVILEYAGFLARMKKKERSIRQERARELENNIRDSLAENTPGPWTIPGDNHILLKAKDIIAISEKFSEHHGDKFSFADLSIIQQAHELRKSKKEIKVLSFDDYLIKQCYKTSHK